jgi:hypothetical protein
MTGKPVTNSEALRDARHPAPPSNEAAKSPFSRSHSLWKAVDGGASTPRKLDGGSPLAKNETAAGSDLSCVRRIISVRNVPVS